MESNINQSKENIKAKEENKGKDPMAFKIYLDSCIKDYERTQERYDNIYHKINIALVFSGSILIFVLSNIDFTSLGMVAAEQTLLTILMSEIEVITLFASILLIFGSTLYLLYLLKSLSITVMKTEAIVDKDIIEKTEIEALDWLIKQYTYAVKLARPVAAKKQSRYDNVLIFLIVGIAFYLISIILRKVGF